MTFTEKIPEFVKRPLIFGTGAMGAFGLVVFIGMYRFTSYDSRVCATCHSDKGAQWEVSQMHRPADAACIDCHTNPGHTGPYGMVAAKGENINDNCLSCHGDMPRAIDEKRHLIKVNHKTHVTDEGCTCTDCHKNVGHDDSAAPTNRPTKWACYACHVHRREIDGKVDKKNCMRCHYQIPDRPEEKK